MKPINTFPPCFFKASFRWYLSVYTSYEWLPPFRLLNQNFVRISHLFMHAACPANVMFDLITLLIREKEYELRHS
jgi:hypothetical protein